MSGPSEFQEQVRSHWQRRLEEIARVAGLESTQRLREGKRVGQGGKAVFVRLDERDVLTLIDPANGKPLCWSMPGDHSALAGVGSLSSPR